MVNDSFDLYVLPLHRQMSQELGGVPSVHVALPPRRSGRGRKSDRLAIFLLFEGQHAFSRERIKQLMDTMEKVYFSTAGSVTSAMRVLVGDLNEMILKHNHRQANTGQQVVAHLSITVVRGGHLYLSQSGPSHGFLLTAGNVEHIHDAQTAGRGLGVSRNPQVRFSQTEVTNRMLLVLTSIIPKGWNAGTLQDAFGQPLKTVFRRFLDQAEGSFSGLMLEARVGKGELHYIRSSKQLGEIVPRRAEKSRQRPSRRPAVVPESDKQAWEPVEIPDDAPRRETKPPPPIIATPVDPGEARPSRTETLIEEPRLLSRRPAHSATPVISKALLGFGTFLGRVKQGLRTFLVRILPDEEVLTISAPFMAITAIAVPLIIITVAALVYSSIGRTQQFQYYYTQAEAMVQLAQTETDFNAIHDAWENAIDFLDLAEEYQTTPESQALRKNVLDALDRMDEVIRLDFKAAIAGNLSSAIKIRQMVATDQNLYILDIVSGHVMRAWLAGAHYEMDPDFRCGPGQYGAMIVDKIIDIAPLQRPTEENAEIVALDGNGNLLYCIPEEAPLAVALEPPDILWGEPTAITVENRKLYVLDPLTNAVWYYEGDENYQFREAPYFFFREEVPTLKGAIDIAYDSDRDFLYILFDDGHTTTCTFSTLKESPTSCVDPAQYTDSRQGREDGPQLTNMIFYQIHHTQPPEPSLYYLDPIDRAIYQFSLRLNLVQLYRPQVDFPEGLATAFAISPTRSIFLAQENKVYQSFLP
ncbi:MAG: hypothetical protein AMK69_19245 [Nitrospira bacterium SG8_3]|nr:MAG: hypothetical protein AMK69_19245 [Nitrospira bacterium SG8_3]